MPSISSTLPALTYLALPAPGAAATANARAGVPVQPVPPVTRRTDQQDQAGSSGQTGERGATRAAGQERTAAAAGNGNGAATASPLKPASPTQASTGFVTQSLSQESLGSGLHIEPWSAALGSYRSAAALPASATRSPGVVV